MLFYLKKDYHLTINLCKCIKLWKWNTNLEMKYNHTLSLKNIMLLNERGYFK